MSNWIAVRAERLSFSRLSLRAQRVATAVAAIAFIGMGVVAIGRFEPGLGELSIPPLMGVVATAPLPLLLSAAEFRATASLLNRRSSWTESLRIALLGYGLNHLPLPGGTLLRISALSDDAEHRPVTRSTGATVAVGGVWLALALALAGAGALGVGNIAAAVGLLSAFAVVSAVSLRFLRGFGRPDLIYRVVAIEFAFVAISTVRTFLALEALGAPDASLMAAAMVAAASAVSTAIGIVPAGLGIRELVASLMASLAGIGPEAGFLAAALLRITGAFASGLVGLVAFAQNRRASVRTH